MPLPNKFEAFCVDWGRRVPAGDGLTEKKETLGLAGSGWLTKHRGCTFTPVRRPIEQPRPSPVFDEWDEYQFTMGMTESEFFGGDIGDKH